MELIKIYCVNYNSTSALIKFIQSVLSQELDEKVSVQVVVCDNSEDAQKLPIQVVEKMARPKVSIKVYRLHNHGYFPGVKEAISLEAAGSRVERAAAKFFMICNVDICLEPDFFLKLMTIRIPPAVGVIGPSIVTGHNAINTNPKLRKKPKLSKLKLNKIFFHSPVLFFLMKFAYKLRLTARSCFRASRFFLDERNAPFPPRETVYAVHGACMIFTEAFWTTTRPFLYPLSLFGEEVYVAERALQEGYTVEFHSHLGVRDDPGVSTGTLARSEYCRLNKAALNYLIEEFYE